MDRWSSQACYGYVILAAEEAGLKEEQIRQLTKMMHCVHNEVSVEEAAKYYRESAY